MNTPPQDYPTVRTNLPTVAALAAAVILFGLVIGLVIMLANGEGLDSDSTPIVVSLVGVVITAVPALIGAAFSERASKDIRNGTVTAKARQGASEALVMHGPEVAREGAASALADAQVITRTGPVVTAELLALTKILGHIDNLAAHPPTDPPTDPEGA